MAHRAICFIALCVSWLVFSGETCVQAETVSYQGDLTLDGGPVPNGFVIAGTFAPGFDPQNYKFVYGDGAGNLLGLPHYSEAVADGNFRPIGSGTQTFPDGAFTGSGFDAAGPGHLVYLFAFDNHNPGFASHFALATNPSWVTGASSLNISAANATQFIFGEKRGTTLGLIVQPFPEPSSLSLAVVMGVALLSRAGRLSH